LIFLVLTVAAADAQLGNDGALNPVHSWGKRFSLRPAAVSRDAAKREKPPEEMVCEMGAVTGREPQSA
jgi:hypothetical protein